MGEERWEKNKHKPVILSNAKDLPRNGCIDDGDGKLLAVRLLMPL